MVYGVNMKSYVILHNIRSIHNVGSIFRTADAVGVTKIFLTGYTPTPVDRFSRPRKDLAKVALGAEKDIPWEYFKNPSGLIRKLRAVGVFVVAIEQAPRAINYKKARTRIKFPVAFVYGNEVEGITPKILKECDIIAEIPMSGKKESLNVSVSAGITLFSLLKK
ncbi:TrmH family RNA methyltransferase [Candidatus Parcubacteria bacterium]|nr:TrmH family RNA methyltransferase [Candidatus Parcubacteria bacterium]